MADEFQLGSDSWRDTSSPSSSAAFRGGSLAAFPAGGLGMDWNDLLRGDKGGEEDSSSIYGLLLSDPIQHQNHSYLYPNPINSGQTWSGSSNIHFTNATPFWNSLSAPSSFATSYFDERPKKNDIETTNKRSRSDTTSSPTMSSSNFKVKKEKMGDKVTALQQLVSPFGKTDTASVLSEAIDNIKFLHDQVCALLSAPYTSNEAPSHILHQQQNYEKCKDGDDEDLRNRGLCLVPISSVTSETT